MSEQTSLITITENAAAKVAELILEEPGAIALRIFVQGGGCSGFQYGFAWEEDAVNEDDFTIEQNGVKFVIDAMSMQYMTGARVDFYDDLTGTGFKIENPQAETTCGCGSSFSMTDDYDFGPEPY
jgi:iron-sulfur cluster insertion protein